MVGRQNIRFTLAQITLQIQDAEEVNPQLVQLQLKLVKEEKNLLLMGGHGAGYNSPKPEPITEKIISTHRKHSSS